MEYKFQDQKYSEDIFSFGSALEDFICVVFVSNRNIVSNSAWGFVDKFVRDPNKTPDSSQRPPPNCPKCGNPVDGLYCRQCALLRKKLKEVWSTICYEDEIFQDFLNTSESSNDKTNVVNAPQEPFVFNQDPGENSSQRPPHIDHHCCYGCGDSLDVSTISNLEPCHNQNVDEFPQTLPSFHPTCYSGDGSSFTYDSTPNFVDDSPNVFNPPSQPPTYSCEFCGNDAHYGYDCPPQVPFIYNPEPCYNQDFNFLQNFQCFQQQYICCTRCGGPHETFQCQQVIFYEPCCENCGGPHETFQCQPMNENYYELNFCYNSNSFGFDQFQPSQFIIDHIDSMNDHLKAQQVLNDSMSKLREMFQTWLQQRQEQVVNLDIYTPEPLQCQKIPICYDDDDDEYSFATQEYLKKFSSAIIPDLPKSDSLIMEDKHLDTIPEAKSDELIKSSVEDLVHTPSESDGISESKCDLLVCGDSSPKKDEVLNDIISIPSRNGNDHFNAESSLIEYVLNRDNVISSPKIDFLLEEFAGELALIAPIPLRIVEANFDSKGDIRFIENLMYDNSFPRPPETLRDDSETALPPDSELVSLEVVEIVIPEVGGIDTDILLTIKDGILCEKLLNVNLLIAKIEALKDNPTPSFDFVTKSSSTSLNFFLEETNTFDNSLPESETFCFNLKEISSGSLTSYLDLSLPDYEAFFCDSEPDSGNFTMDVVEDIFDNPTREPRVHVPNVLPTHPTLQLDSDFTLSSDYLGSDLVVSFPSGTRNKIFDLGIFIEVQSKIFLSPNESISFIRDPLSSVFDTLLPFSSENEDNIFNPGILASNEEKSPHLLSHRGFKAFQLISESPMMISGGDIPILDVLIARIVKTRARGFVLRSLDLHILSFILGIQYPNLID
ncbi:hypothetical protein Tco_0446098 [Tanacetum coccineum]